MFDSYRVAVKISLVNQVSTGLLAMSRQFQKTGADAEKLQLVLHRIKLLGITGAAIGGAGFMGLGLLSKMLKPAEEYSHQLNIMNMAGLKHRELAEAIGDAWKNTGTVITTTATENLRTLLDLRNVLGDLGEARVAMPMVSRIQAVLAASTEGKISGQSKDLAYGVAKSLDMIGAVQNKEMFEKQAELMSKVIIATQGRVLPTDYMMAFKYARQAKYQMSDNFKYQILPSLMQEMKGGGSGGGSGGPGAMLAAMYRMTNQGYINKMSLPELVRLGLVNPNSVLRTTTSGTTVGPMRDAALAASNPFEWVQQVLVPAIHRQYGKNLTQNQLMSHINTLFRGNQLAAALVGEFAVKPINFYRDAANIRGTMSTADAYKAAVGNDPITAHTALASQWTNFKTALTMSVVPVLIPLLMDLTKGLQHLASWMREHQGLAKKLVIGFGVLAGAMAISGTLLAVTAGFKAIGAVLTFASLGGVAGLARIAGAFTTMAGGLVMMAPALLALYASWKGGQAVGGGINSGISRGLTKLRGVDSSLGTAIYDWTHPHDADRGYVRGASRNSGPLRADVHIDGRKFASIMTEYQSRAMTGPQRGSSTFDVSMMPPTVGMPITGTP